MPHQAPRVNAYVVILLAFIISAESFAAKKDFKGLFGSYRREKFTENEARNSDFGMDIMLSTLLPLGSFVLSSENRPFTNGQPMSFSTFFNLEASVFYTINYHWMLYGSIAYYTYDTRKENGADPANPLFHHFDLSAFPLIGGVKYRFTTTDIVPYIGAGAGIAYTHRKGYYDSSTTIGVQDYSTVLALNALVGVEFYFAPRMGLRLETSALFLGLSPRAYDPNGTPSISPLLQFQGNTWSVRYASGLFFLF